MNKSTIFALVVLILTGNTFVQAQNFLYAKGLRNPLPQGGDVVGLSIKADRLGNTYVAGYFSGTADFDPGAGEAIMVAKIRQLFLARYDSSGKYMFARAIGGTENLSDAYIDIDRLNNVYMTGTFTGTVDFDPGPGTASFTSAGSRDAFIARYDSTGNYVGAKTLGSTSSDQANSIAIDSSGNIYICGSFQITVGSASPNVSAVIAKYDSSFHYILSILSDSLNIRRASDIAVDSQSNIYVTGETLADLLYQPFIAKYDAAGKRVYITYKFGTGTEQYGQSIAVDRTGNAYITGISGQYYSDVYLAKFDLFGTALFTKHIVGSGTDAPASLELDGKGHLYVTGSFQYSMDFDPGPGTATLTSAGGYDIFVAGYDTSGNYLFAYAQGGKSYDVSRSIAINGTGDLFVAGIFTGRADFNPGPDSAILFIDGGYNAFVSRTSKEGLYKWASQLGTYSSTALYERGRSIAVDAQGNTYITGRFAGTLDFDPGSGVANLTSAGFNNAFFAKYDNQGNYVFAKAIGGSEGTDITLDDSGCIYVIGHLTTKGDFDPGEDSVFLIRTGLIDMFLAKYSATGKYIYAKSIGSQRSDSYTYGYDITVDKAGNAFVCGQFSGNTDFDPGPGTAMLTNAGQYNTFFACYDAQGNYVFAKSFVGRGSNAASDIAIDSVHNIYVTGSFDALTDFDPGNGISNLSSAGYTDIFFAKYDQAGNYIYAKRLGSTGYDYGSGMVVDGSGNVFLTGSFENAVDFDPDPAGLANVITAGRSDIFIAKYDPEGRYVYAKAVGGIGNDGSPLIVSDGSGNVYVTGYYQGTVDFDPGSGTVNLTSRGESDIFIAKYDNNGNYLFARTMESTAVIPDARGIAADGVGNFYYTGSIAGTANFNRGGDSTNSIISNSNSNDIFFAKYGPLAALPVTLTAFKAEKVNNGMQVKVYWTAASQLNNDYFEVERSNDGVHFESIGQVRGCAVCIDAQKYEYYDNHPLNGFSYYRLKQADRDGKAFYSVIVTINNATRNKIIAEAFPAISTGTVKIVIHDNKQKKQVVLQLTDGGGRLIKQEHVWLSEGDSIFDYNLTSQISGMYYLRITDSNGTTLSTLKIIKR
jgi:hypothetical protein